MFWFVQNALNWSPYCVLWRVLSKQQKRGQRPKLDTCKLFNPLLCCRTPPSFKATKCQLTPQCYVSTLPAFTYSPPTVHFLSASSLMDSLLPHSFKYISSVSWGLAKHMGSRFELLYCPLFVMLLPPFLQKWTFLFLESEPWHLFECHLLHVSPSWISALFRRQTRSDRHAYGSLQCQLTKSPRNKRQTPLPDSLHFADRCVHLAGCILLFFVTYLLPTF